MISNDVNVIFAYLEARESNHKKAVRFVSTNQRRRYIMLANVMKSFVKTYKDYILYVGDSIVNQVQLFTEERKRSPKKSFSGDFIVKMIEPRIDNDLRSISDEFEMTLRSLTNFKNLLLGYYSLPQLYFEEESVGEFKETFIEEAEKFAIGSLNEFGNRFNNKKLMKMTEYMNYDEVLSRIEMSDFEDKKICAELFCFGKEKNKIGFLTFDRDFNDFLKKHGRQNNVDLLEVE